MYSASKSKPLLLSPKADTSRFHNTFSPKLGSPSSNNPAEILAYHKELLKQGSPTNRDSQKVPHFLPKGAQSTIYYKNKRPVEIADLGESDRNALNSSIPGSYEARQNGPYDTGNSQNVGNAGTPFLSTREGHSKEGEGFMDNGENDGMSYRTVYSGQKANSNSTNFLAEKVYKMKGSGVINSLLPLSKSKSPTNMPLSLKNAMSTPNKSGFREADSYQSCFTTNARSGIAYQGDISNSSMVNKRPGTDSHKSLGKGGSERKAINSNAPLTENLMKRDNSWGKIKKTQNAAVVKSDNKKVVPASAGDKGKAPAAKVQYPLSPVKQVNNQASLKSKVEMLVNRVSMVWWHSNQRDKRSVFVLLTENWQQTEQKLAKHLERKASVLKSRCFCLWQEFLLEINLERQRIQQEKAEEMKTTLADMFHDRKLTRKAFNLLRMANEILPKTLSKNSGIHPKSAKSLRQPSISLQKSPSKPVPSSITAIKGHTPQAKSRTMIPKQKSISEKKNNISSITTSTTAKTASKPALPPKTYVPVDSRSKSVGKILKDNSKITTTPKSQVEIQLVMTDSSKQLNNSAIDSPTQKETSLNYSRNGKHPIRVYEPSEIIEATELSQSPKKGDRDESDGIGELENSIGRGSFGKSFEKGRGNEAFDFILAEILHPSESPKNVQRVKTEGNDDESPKVVVTKSDPTRKPSPQKNNFMLKLDAVAKTTREISSTSKSVKESPKKQSFTARSRYDESKFGQTSSKKTLDVVTPPKRTVSARPRNPVNEEEQENNAVERINLEKALAFRRKRLLQIPFVWLLAAAAQTKEELEEKTIMAEINYQNSLKIKSLSGLLEHFVKAFKQNQLYNQYYEDNLLRKCMAKWIQIVPPKSTSEAYDSDEGVNYEEIVERFRFIVLAEKAIRQWKDFIASNKKPVVVKKTRKY